MSTLEAIKPFPTREQFPSGLTEATEEWFKHTAKNLDWNAVETLVALMRAGPLYDGDVPSKSGRDTLLKHDLCAKIVVSGRKFPNECYVYAKPPALLDPSEHKKYYAWGYQAATYTGARVYKALLEIGRIEP